MLRRIIDWLRSDVWRIATIGLALVLGIVVLVFSVDGSNPDPVESGSEQPPTTTPVGDDSSDVAGDDDSSDVASDGESSGPAGGTEETNSARSQVSSSKNFLAIKVDNAPGARPQVGVASTTLLIEVPVEGGMTRFLTIHPSNASGVVGPVRSVRPVDVDLLPPLATIFVSSGGQETVLQALAATGIPHIDSTTFEFLSGGRENPHDTFIDLDVLMPLLAGSESDAFGLPTGELAEATGRASSVELPIGPTELRFVDGAYSRYESGEPFLVLDSLGGQPSPLVHETVIVIFVAQRFAGYGDSNGVPVLTFDVIGGGDLLVFHDGEVVEATWSRSAQEDPFVFLDGARRPFGIPEGSTYLAIVPRDLQVVFSP